jgi:cytochrome-b5 reductase
MIQKHCFPPAADTSVFVCGPPAMYDSYCGPRTDKELAEGTVLQKLGYDASMVFKF